VVKHEYERLLPYELNPIKRPIVGR
jgi:hypothetical protein